LLTEYDNATAKIRNLEESESTLKTQVDSLQEGVKERDRNMNKMREQMKYYIAFAENSINGHLDSGPREENETNQLQKLIKELQEAQVRIIRLDSL
jgi:chaperonin cofactor prefoldin